MADGLFGGGGAAFGVYPQMQPRRSQQDIQGSANIPVDVLRGRIAGLFGLVPDMLNFMGRSPMPTETFGNTQYQLEQQIPYGSEYFLKNLPLAPTSRAGLLAGQAASFVPLNPVPAVRAVAAGGRALGPTAARMTEEYLVKTGGILPLDVYHGSPYKFDKFDSAKIGTGEGAQAYGHGLYLAENKAVAQGYKDQLAPRDLTKKTESQIDDWSSWAAGAGDDANDAVQKVANLVQQSKANSPLPKGFSSWDDFQSYVQQETQKRFGGSLYKVDLPDDQIAKMLDYDKPLSQQPEIMKALTPEAMGLKLRVSPQSGFMGYVSPDGVPIGLQIKGATPENFRKRWLERLAEFGDAEGGAGRAIGYLGGTSENSAAQVSEALRQAGIPGIKYFDEGSRIKGEGTRNFVTFPGEEKNLTILERNGQVASPMYTDPFGNTITDTTR